MAEHYGLELLGEIPLDPSIRAAGDQGMPITEESPESAAAERYIELSRRVAAKVSKIQVAGPPPAPEEEGSSKGSPGRRSLPVVG